MRVYDEMGDMVKSRVPDEGDEKKPSSSLRSINLRNKSKSSQNDDHDDMSSESGPEDDENDDEDDDNEPLRPSAPVSYHFVSHPRCVKFFFCLCFMVTFGFQKNNNLKIIKK